MCVCDVASIGAYEFQVQIAALTKSGDLNLEFGVVRTSIYAYDGLTV